MKPKSSPTSQLTAMTSLPKKIKQKISRLSTDWRKLAQAELALRADEQAAVKLKDRGLYYIFTAKDHLSVSKYQHIREYRTKMAFEKVHEMLTAVGFSFAGWGENGEYRVYERLDKRGQKIIVEWGYFETAEGIKRHFRYIEDKRLERTMKRDFLLMLVKLKRKQGQG